MASVGGTTRANLGMQGFGYLDDEEQARFAWPLRFTPAVGTALVAVGLITESPWLLAAVSAIALSGALFPHGMAIDVAYNYGVRHLFRAPRLPATPTPRRYSYLLSTALLAGSAASFAYGLTASGWILGGLVVIGGTILASTLWCLGSWIFNACTAGMTDIHSAWSARPR
ncbi:MAG: DUF4395 family protein [Actinomycetota bacterium]|nr:DUF4395 family protein [Actinomycetota bacterium]